MNRKNKIIITILIAIILILVVLIIFNYSKNNKLEKTFDAYISSSNNSIQITSEDQNETINITRGTKVTLYEKEVKTENNKVYRKIKYNDNYYLVLSDYITTNYQESIKESEVFVRTSLTTYKSTDDVSINGFAKKGTKLNVTGFDKLNDDGSVNMYQINNNGNISYIYAKYVVQNEDEALAVYNENGTYDIHKDRKYSYELYGGSPKNLDYYPYEKPSFSDNKLVDQAKTYYLVGTYYILSEVDKYIELAKEAKADAFVIDIKDGALAYKSEISKDYSISSYNAGMNSVEFYKTAIKKIQDAGFYTIGRIVLFNDSTFAKDNPDECIKTPEGKATNWVSAYSRKAWEYNVKLALEAIDLFDFNEIQFDYVRFPESSYSWSSKNYDFNNKYNEDKAEAIQNFLFYATDEIHKKNTYISVDVFGECSNTYVTAYGQYWPAISNIVDVISSMPYTDHFSNDSYYWTHPYETVNNWAKGAAARQKEIPTPAKTRTWITAYDTPYWNVTTIYGADEIEAQVKGLVDAGLGHGFITWNSGSSYSKYKAIAKAFSKEY